MHAISSLANIRIVLVDTSHPGNIGAAARAMKTMGLTQLALVNPRFFPHDEATARATQAEDILTQAQVHPTLADAVQDCTLILGTSARSRELVWPTLTAREAGPKILQEATGSPVAIVFGREKSGLTNEELQTCHYQVEIPSNPNYSSLNLAAAVQIICYEIRMALFGEKAVIPVTTIEEALATADETERLYGHLEQTLIQLELVKPGTYSQIMPRLRRLFSRARLQKIEINILRGILTAMEKHLPKKPM